MTVVCEALRPRDIPESHDLQPVMWVGSDMLVWSTGHIIPIGS